MRPSEVAEDDQWALVRTLLPADLEETAVSTLAIIRRREIKEAGTLLRLAFAYSWGKTSARGTCGWAAGGQRCHLSNVSLLERMHYCADWLGLLVAQKLQQRGCELGTGLEGHRLRIVDASCINRDGVSGTDQRLHLSFGLDRFCIDSVELTDSSGGETLKRFDVQPGDVLIADRGYSHRGGVAYVVEQGGDVVVRINWQNFPLRNPDGSALDILERLRSLRPGDIGDWDVVTAADGSRGIGGIAGRLIAIRKSPEAAERERRRVNQQAKKRGRTADQRSLEAADYVFVFTTLSREEAPAERVLEWFRFRWQIELVFKRLKGILELGQIPRCGEALLRTIVLARMMCALIIEDLAEGAGAFSPWGYGLPATCKHRQAV